MRTRIKELIEAIRQQRAERMERSNEQQAGRRIQVREFNKQLCLAFDGIPILPLKDFDNEVLTEARKTFNEYLNN